MPNTLLKRAAEGAAAGIAGTFALQGVMLANQRFFPQAQAPEHEDPASFVLWQGQRFLPRKAFIQTAKYTTPAGIALSLAYGATFGAVYGAIRGKKSPNAAITGALLGVAVWAIGYLGWLPATNLIPPIHRQTPAQITGPIVEHLVYGLITAGAFEYLTQRW